MFSHGTSLLAIVLLFSALWAAVARDRALLKPEVSDDEVNALLLSPSPSIGFYAGAIALTIVAPGPLRSPTCWSQSSRL